jgi:hypothetical protein
MFLLFCTVATCQEKTWTQRVGTYSKTKQKEKVKQNKIDRTKQSKTKQNKIKEIEQCSNSRRTVLKLELILTKV